SLGSNSKSASPFLLYYHGVFGSIAAPNRHSQQTSGSALELCYTAWATRGTKLISRPPSKRGTSVCDDWCAWLPDSKYRVNESCSKELETLYVMLSVTLDEALDLRRKGSRAQAAEAAAIAGGLCVRFTQSLR